MSSDWQSYQLDDLCEFINGFAFKSTDYVEPSTETVEVLRMGYISRGGGFKEDSTPVFVPKKYGKNLDKYFLKQNDVVIAMTDMKDKVAILGNTAWISHADRFVLNQRVGCIRVKRKDLLSSRFFYYYSNSQSHIENLRKRANSGVQVNLSTSAIKESLINIPPLSEQNQIAEILGAIDDRITLLLETKTTIEAIVQAIFKSWFVDFEPIHAKQLNLAPRTMYETNFENFPDSFVESELGLIPKGWQTIALYDLAQYINGAAYKAFNPNSEQRGLPIIKIAELKAGVTKQTGYSDVSMPEKYKIRTGDILFSWSGNPDTSIDTFVWSHTEAWLNQHIFRVVPRIPVERSFVLMTLRHLNPIFIEIARNKQTTGLGHVTVADLKRLRVVKPNSLVLEKWNEIADPLLERAFNLMQQAQNLSNLRDTLLPRLISGQLRLNDVKKMAE